MARAITHGLLEGLTDGEIAVLLGLSEKTVNSHMRHLTAKLGAKNRTHAVVQALRGNLLQLDK
jgi:DNA-binding CsgD family transcriptional regulator